MGNLPISLETNVKTKLKVIIGELIPEEMLDKIVLTTSQEFMIKDLPQIIKDLLKEEYVKKIKEELAEEKMIENLKNNLRNNGLYNGY